jgi:DNA-binding NarL/FixJ family response regulator
MKPVRVLVVDDHPLVRTGVCALLRAQPDVEVVGEAANGREAVDAARRLRPDVVLMDVSMPAMDGIEAAGRITGEFPEVRVVMLSLHADAHHVRQALRAGASGYLLKNLADELAPAIRTVAEGRSYYSAAVAGHLKEADTDARRRTEPVELLTPRQREILKLIAEGYTTKEIADRLNISLKTAQTHRQQLMERLDIHEVAGLVRFAIRNGIITPEL